MKIGCPRSNGTSMFSTRVALVHSNWNECGKVLYIWSAGRTDTLMNSYVYNMLYNIYLLFFWFTLCFSSLFDKICELTLNATNVIDPDSSDKSQLDISPEPWVFVNVLVGYTHETMARILNLDQTISFFPSNNEIIKINKIKSFPIIKKIGFTDRIKLSNFHHLIIHLNGKTGT